MSDFSYILTEDVGKVRRNIGDTSNAEINAGSGVRWDGSNLTNTEIQSYLDENGGHVDTATAYCLLMLSSEYSVKATTMQMGSFREEMEMVATELRRSANTWFSEARERERNEGIAKGGTLAKTYYVTNDIVF